jgi:two-component system OmpR family response regulator
MKALRNIMIVDDQPDIHELATISLQNLGGFTVTSCFSGEEALLRVPTVKPQLVLIDIVMPGLDGLETFRQLRRDPGNNDTPVAFMTGAIPSFDDFKKLGVAGLIPKPFSVLTLSEEISLIHANWAAEPLRHEQGRVLREAFLRSSKYEANALWRILNLRHPINTDAHED